MPSRSTFVAEGSRAERERGPIGVMWSGAFAAVGPIAERAAADAATVRTKSRRVGVIDESCCAFRCMVNLSRTASQATAQLAMSPADQLSGPQ